DFRRFPGDRRRVRRIGRESRSHVALPTRPREQLVVRREQLHLPERSYAKLNARASELLPLDALLDDSTLRRQSRDIRIERDRRKLEGHGPNPPLHLRRLARIPRDGEP